MRFTLVGAGAVGALWGLKLFEAGHQVHFVTRKEESQITLGFEHQKPQTFSANQPSLGEDSDCLVVCVKAFQVIDAISAVKSHLHPDTPVVLMHNGMGTANDVLQTLDTNPLVLATTSHGALKISPSVLRHTGLGETRLGGANVSGKQCDFLADVFSHALPSAKWEKDIQTALWRKLAVNCMINPMTALRQCQNGELLSDSLREQLNTLSEEIALVMQAEGLNVASGDVLQHALQVAKATAENHSSMNRDVHFKRRSEIDFITGYLISRAESHDIAVPENRALYQAIKNLELSYDHA
ncbi:2-dehydropantoate 2-reductase [Grimontia sp. NTOU-MAR1]|uniref:2-dehydropantoate 2-reductase n=1 Tax=Grimontia sp. NTOU-MAR1 TaxID=3111011 RepID=UPI002DBCC5D5|nr:2-dehydropantoate 2-reductase [Grimontia sp. NTOU-MAR1]WRV99203.1 2-dehydropantoate 2-reductase [Grimontia sp. NTOU-MAR1]